MGFSVEGSATEKKALMQDAIQKFGLNLDRHFAGFFGDVIRYGRSFDDCLVGEDSLSILMAGGRQSTHYVLPADYDNALDAIGRFFGRVAPESGEEMWWIRKGS
jgi:hypothetical protein